MNTNLNDYKNRAKNLRSAVSSVLNIECTQSQAYELIAKEENYPNWDSLSGILNKNTEKQDNGLLTNKEQIFQLFFIYDGLNNSGAFFDLISMLKQQKNPVIKKGWSNIIVSADSTIYDMLSSTNLFSEEALFFIKMGVHAGRCDHGIKSAIEFLKM